MVGDILRREREKQGLTIQDVESETSIRALYLTAIEKGDYQVLPGDVYTKGFIRNYAKFLNIDGDALLQQYNVEHNIEAKVQPIDVPGKETVTPAAKIAKPQVIKSSEPSNQSQKSLFSGSNDYQETLGSKQSGSKKFLVFLGIVVVFLTGVYIAFSEDESVADKPVVKQEQTANKAKPAEKKYDGVEVKAKFAGASWMSVEADGKNIFEGTVEAGKEMSWQAKENMVILAGNAGQVTLTWNGKELGTMGEKGQIATRTMTKDNDGSKPVQVENSAPAEPEPEVVTPKTTSRKATKVEPVEEASEKPAPVAEKAEPAVQEPVTTAPVEVAPTQTAE